MTAKLDVEELIAQARLAVERTGHGQAMGDVMETMMRAMFAPLIEKFNVMVDELDVSTYRPYSLATRSDQILRGDNTKWRERYDRIGPPTSVGVTLKSRGDGSYVAYPKSPVEMQHVQYPSPKLMMTPEELKAWDDATYAWRSPAAARASGPQWAKPLGARDTVRVVAMTHDEVFVERASSYSCANPGCPPRPGSAASSTCYTCGFPTVRR